MVLDLYDERFVRRANRQSGQIETRDCKLQPQYKDLKGLDKYFKDAEELQQYKEKILSILDKPREYQHIGGARLDSHFEVELLGICDSRPYVMVTDWSYSLAYLLHTLFDCKVKDIESIEDYDQISYAILNAKFDLVSDKTLSILAEASPQMLDYFSKAIQKNRAKFSNRNARELFICYDLYTQIMGTMNHLAVYTATKINDYFHETNPNLSKGVIRSIGFSKVVSATTARVDEEVIVRDPSGILDDYRVMCRTYEPYEYVGEEMFKNEFNRKR